MKKCIISTLVAFSSMLLLTGCMVFIGDGSNPGFNSNTTLGQQLIDLQKANNLGALTDAEFQAQKAKLLKRCK